MDSDIYPEDRATNHRSRPTGATAMPQRPRKPRSQTWQPFVVWKVIVGRPERRDIPPFESLFGTEQDASDYANAMTLHGYAIIWAEGLWITPDLLDAVNTARSYFDTIHLETTEPPTAARN